MSNALAPLIASILHALPSTIERTLRHETACQALVAHCAALSSHIEAHKARIAQEKAAQRLLRAEIAAFLRERGQLRSANSSRVMEDSLMLSNASVVTDPEDSIMDVKSNSSLYQESPLCLKAKRKGRIFDAELEILPKRRRLTAEIDDAKPAWVKSESPQPSIKLEDTT